MDPINIKKRKSFNQAIHDMATLNIAINPSQSPATAMHPMAGSSADVAVHSKPARAYPEPAWVTNMFTQSSPTRPSSTHTTQAIMPGTSTSSSPARPKVVNSTPTWAFILQPQPQIQEAAPVRQSRPRPVPHPFPGHYKPHRHRHHPTSSPKSMSRIACARLSEFARHPPTTQLERNRQASLMALATGEIDNHPLSDLFRHRMSMKTNNQKREQCRLNRLLARAKAKRAASYQKMHRAMMESSIESLASLSLTDTKEPKDNVHSSSVMAREVKLKHATGGTGKEDSLEDLDVDEYLYLNENSDGMEM
ncbi:hypothetical protein QBC32DRAFT_383744 [Pseudoneurospora amorphoporcata]|uniref:Uncharacterized protein n=1 Tax=Pseudoneurospora amorphoporcata TaxID=241081 RepID=A0AAN6SBH6_9PEZI|nr:hypothetical protein QBC32DRAFT_383744 [Pseudoneurospora amorphoporcata]